MTKPQFEQKAAEARERFTAIQHQIRDKEAELEALNQELFRVQGEYRAYASLAPSESDGPDPAATITATEDSTNDADSADDALAQVLEGTKWENDAANV